MRNQRGLTSLGAAAALLAWASAAFAHDETVSSSAIEIGDRTIVWKIDVGVEGLGKVSGLASLVAPGLDGKRLQELSGAIGRYLASRVQVTAGSRALPVEVGPLEPVREGDAGLARVLQTLIHRSPGPLDEVHLRIGLFEELTSAHRAIVAVGWAGERRTFVRTGPFELALTRGQLLPRASAVASDFLRWGIDHIFRGYDHLAFLLCLILAAPRVRALVKVITAFTLAHSLTLVLAALDLVRVPGRLAEIAIAASVVYVAADNLMRGQAPARHRAALAFALGLVHGLGLAGDLRDRLADTPGRLALAVASFNVGVELGQIAVAVAVFLLLSRLRQQGGPRVAQRADRFGSLACLLLGLYWLVTRLAAS